VARRGAEAGLDLARAERRQVEADRERARALHERDFLAQQEVDRLTTQLEVARARERQAAEAVAMATQDLEDTVVRAPFAGSISERRADEGTAAQPQSVVVVLQETGVLEARAAISEASLAHVQVGDRARLHLEGFRDPIETRVATVGDTIDTATRTYLVRMAVPNPDHRFKAGVFAHVEIEPSSKSNVLLIPRQAIRSEEGRSEVLVVRGGRVVPMPVRLGVVSEQEAEVVEGLTGGEEIVTGEAAQLISPETKVRAVAATGSAA
jgi:RND family efflux transporter MFP subunit